ncbi:hypothetical protein BDV96DRAFT_676068 [Lophiotrema nucula]|uniref:General substrate transporter n=1 Tax=Lophiotrema nucula TaxID=690887 RepID=A0A6A5ZK07_9PLEO|nr:hypothetical protein BDV96DRAFT_676068 [Lophiotrema nucula]
MTIGTAIAFWLDYGMHFVGGTKCRPAGVPKSEWYPSDGTFNAAAAHGHACTGEKSVSWRFPLALQLLFAWILFFGMFFLPFSPPWLAMKHRDASRPLRHSCWLLFGRKTFLITGAVGMMICHAIVASIDGSFGNDWPNHLAGGWASIVFIWLFAANFAYSWGPFAWVITPELFPNSLRSRGVAIVASTNWMFNFVIGLTTKDMLASM